MVGSSEKLKNTVYAESTHQLQNDDARVMRKVGKFFTPQVGVAADAGKRYNDCKRLKRTIANTRCGQVKLALVDD
jgi:hypothetical protein